jgi:hypothetical protein
VARWRLRRTLAPAGGILSARAGPGSAGGRLSLAALAAVGCGLAEAPVPQRIVLISVDTLRADHVGCYGAPSARTPHLDTLAARGVRFAAAFSPVPLTLPA